MTTKIQVSQAFTTKETALNTAIKSAQNAQAQSKVDSDEYKLAVVAERQASVKLGYVQAIASNDDMVAAMARCNTDANDCADVVDDQKSMPKLQFVLQAIKTKSLPESGEWSVKEFLRVAMASKFDTMTFDQIRRKMQTAPKKCPDTGVYVPSGECYKDNRQPQMNCKLLTRIGALTVEKLDGGVHSVKWNEAHPLFKALAK